MSGGARFTFIIPVYNGGEYLRQCVRSMLAQTVPDFNIVVLENQSTDGSARWLNSLGDPRITVLEAAEHLPIEANWARILVVPKGEFMTVSGHDDLFAPDYLAVMSRLIAKYPDASLYQAHYNIIDGRGGLVRPCLPMPEKEDAAGFLRALLRFVRDSSGTGYMCRSSDYLRAGGIPLYPELIYADHALWLRLSGFSCKATAAENCFSFRVHGTSASQALSWRVSFAALERFLGFLRDNAGEARFAAELRAWLPEHMLAQFHWARICGGEGAREVVRRQSLLVCDIIGDGGGAFGRRAMAEVFGPLAPAYSFSCRARRWLRRRLHAGRKA